MKAAKVTLPPAILTVAGWLVVNPDGVRGLVIVFLPAAAFAAGYWIAKKGIFDGPNRSSR